MFKALFGKKNTGIVLVSPAKGKAIPLSEVNDPTFAEGILGKGAAVIPEEGKIYSPVDGEIGMVFETKHAVSIVSNDGVEVLVHVGLDTVMLKGQFYEAHVAAGDKVKAGDLMLTVDLAKVKEAGYDVVTPVIICNTDAYKEVAETAAGTDVAVGAEIIKITK